MTAITRRAMLAGLSVGSLSRASAALRSYIDFIHLSDTHIINPAQVHPKLLELRKNMTPTRAALPRSLAAFRRDAKADLVFATGDLIDAFSFLGADGGTALAQVEAFAAILAKSPLPVYPGLGNHDLLHYGLREDRLAPDQSVAERAKAAWIRNVSAFAEGTYYAFHRDLGGARWRFVMLNNGFQGRSPEPDAAPLPQSFGRAQTDWLAAECRRYPGDALVIGAHIPPAGAALAELERALGARSKLALLLTGHIHASNFVRQLPLSGARVYHIATPAYATGANHFRRVRLHADRAEVFAPGAAAELVASIPVEN